jgi:hypothetical protein
LPDLRSASDVRKGLLSAADDRTREKPLSRPRTPPRRPPSKGGRRITWSRSLATAPGQHTFQPTDGGYTSAASDDQFHATTAPSEYTHGTGGVGRAVTLRQVDTDLLAIDGSSTHRYYRQHRRTTDTVFPCKTQKGLHKRHISTAELYAPISCKPCIGREITASQHAKSCSEEATSDEL